MHFLVILITYFNKLIYYVERSTNLLKKKTVKPSL
jgi:hypothetical protein